MYAYLHRDGANYNWAVLKGVLEYFRWFLTAGFGPWWSDLVLKSFVGGKTRFLVFIVLLARPRLARHVFFVCGRAWHAQPSHILAAAPGGRG